MKHKILIIFFIFFFIGTVHAEIYSCKDENNNVIFTDTPCVKGGAAISYHRSTENGQGYAKFSQGFINGYEGNIPIKDVVAHLSNKNEKNYISLWLYPFKLSLEEIAVADDGAIITRTGDKPARLDFSFSDKLAGDISYKDIEPLMLTLKNGSLVTPSSTQYFQLIKNINLEYNPKEEKIGFSIKGKIDNYSILINTKTHLVYRSSSETNGKTPGELKQKIKNWVEPPAKEIIKPSIQGRLIFHNKVPKKLRIETPRFSVKDVTTGQWVGSFKSNYDPYTAKYSISGLSASNYSVMVNYEYPWKTKGMAAKPGELYGSKQFVIKDKTETVSVDVDMISLVYLLEPINNNYAFSAKERKTYASPITFRWKPLANGTVYNCLVKRVNKVKSHTSLSKHLEMRTKETSISFKLPPGLYHFVLDAYKDDIQTGALRISGEKGYGFEYVFVVK